MNDYSAIMFKNKTGSSKVMKVSNIPAQYLKVFSFDQSRDGEVQVLNFSMPSFGSDECYRLMLDDDFSNYVWAAHDEPLTSNEENFSITTVMDDMMKIWDNLEKEIFSWLRRIHSGNNAESFEEKDLEIKAYVYH